MASLAVSGYCELDVGRAECPAIVSPRSLLRFLSSLYDLGPLRYEFVLLDSVVFVKAPEFAVSKTLRHHMDISKKGLRVEPCGRFNPTTRDGDCGFFMPCAHLRFVEVVLPR